MRLMRLLSVTHLARPLRIHLARASSRFDAFGSAHARRAESSISFGTTGPKKGAKGASSRSVAPCSSSKTTGKRGDSCRGFGLRKSGVRFPPRPLKILGQNRSPRFEVIRCAGFCARFESVFEGSGAQRRFGRVSLRPHIHAASHLRRAMTANVRGGREPLAFGDVSETAMP